MSGNHFNKPPDTSCLRPSRDTPKEKLRAIHKAKMMGKFFRNIETGTATPIIRKK